VPDREFESFAPGVDRIRARVLVRIHRPGVSVVQINHDESTPIRSPDPTIVYADASSARRTDGHPLLLTAMCADPGAWGAIDGAFAEEGFERWGPMSESGAQCYKSNRRAMVIVDASPPGATMAVDRIGKAMLTSIPAP
jgi:hypothetical protein